MFYESPSFIRTGTALGLEQGWALLLFALRAATNVTSFFFLCSEIEYSYRVRRIPFMDYSSKEIIPHQPQLQREGKSSELWRLLRKRYSVRIEFEQSGSLGEF